jgi:hypothetical protein
VCHIDLQKPPEPVAATSFRKVTELWLSAGKSCPTTLVTIPQTQIKPGNPLRDFMLFVWDTLIGDMVL